MRRYRKQLFTPKVPLFEPKILLGKFDLLNFGVLELFLPFLKVNVNCIYCLCAKKCPIYAFFQ